MIGPKVALFLALSSSVVRAGEAREFTHQVTGLFEPSRVEDLKRLCEKLPNITLTKVDYDKAEAEFRYDPALVFPKADAKQTVERFDTLLRSMSRSTFGIKPRCSVPREELTRVEIPVSGLDCKACGLAAYEIVARIEGVENATASFKEGRIVAWIHPQKVNREVLETALEKRNVLKK